MSNSASEGDLKHLFMKLHYSVSDRFGNERTLSALNYEEAAILSGLSGPLRVIETQSLREARYSVHDGKAVRIGGYEAN